VCAAVLLVTAADKSPIGKTSQGESTQHQQIGCLRTSASLRFHTGTDRVCAHRAALKGAEMMVKGEEMLEADGFVFVPDKTAEKAKKNLVHMLASGKKVLPAPSENSRAQKIPAPTTAKAGKFDKLQAELNSDHKISAALQGRLQALQREMNAVERQRAVYNKDAQNVRAQMMAASMKEGGSKLFASKWGASIISDNPNAEGNTGNIWQEEGMTNNFAEPNSKALANGWNSGADTVHDGGGG
jgi:hypothetical protein